MANLLKEEIPQLYALCGAGARSTLRVLRPGLAATEIAVSPLPGNPTAVWTLRRSLTDAFDAYIIVSFTNATLVRCCPAKGNLQVGRQRATWCHNVWETLCIRSPECSHHSD